VDRWCEIESRAAAAIAELCPSADQCEITLSEAEDVQKYEALLTEVGSLAGSLALPNATTVVESPTQFLGRQLAYAWESLRAALDFTFRGFKILFGDIKEVGTMLQNLVVRQRGLISKDQELLRRTIVDIVMLVPYTIIMVIPLSPPGHVFAFSLLNKCFPTAVPSPFTSQRQDVYEIYTRIAADAAANSEASASGPWEPLTASGRSIRNALANGVTLGARGLATVARMLIGRLHFASRSTRGADASAEASAEGSPPATAAGASAATKATATKASSTEPTLDAKASSTEADAAEGSAESLEVRSAWARAGRALRGVVRRGRSGGDQPGGDQPDLVTT